MDQGRREARGAATALTLRPGGLARPTRFEPPSLTAITSSRDLMDQHAEELAAMRRAAHEEGLRAARAEVDAAVAEHHAARRRLESAAASLMRVAEQVSQHDREAIDAVQHQAVLFGVSVAEEMLGRELRSFDDTVLASVERAVALVPDRGEVVVRLHPADVEVVRAEVDQWSTGGLDITLVADQSVAPGGCVAVVGPLRIDAQLGSALDRVRVALG